LEGYFPRWVSALFTGLERWLAKRTDCLVAVSEAIRDSLLANRLDSKNWTPTPAPVQERIIDSFLHLAENVDAMILMDQVDLPETGVVTARLLESVGCLVKARPSPLIIADSRRSLKGYPPVCLKMNSNELNALTSTRSDLPLLELKRTAASLEQKQGRSVFVTLAERGILGAAANGEVEHVPALPVRGVIDIVGAGDSVTANLAAALAAGATLRESLEIAMAAASIVIHQLGTTGTALVPEIQALIQSESD
jgi:bifunctional ADP-heptose synthase (sugar kinase/adenylyltransferase)